MAVEPQAALMRRTTAAASANPAPWPPTSGALISPPNPASSRASMEVRAKVPVRSTSAAAGPMVVVIRSSSTSRLGVVVTGRPPGAWWRAAAWVVLPWTGRADPAPNPAP